MHRRAPAWWIVYLVVPLIVGAATIAPALQGPGLPIESNDETAHTFIDLVTVHRSLSHGRLLAINLGANFGTPLLGDPVVCPFAPHAITYALLAPVTAVLVNKFVMAALAIVLLTAFFAAYLPTGVASICAVLTFTSPAYLYSFHHHPHQGVLVYFPALLLSLRAFLRAPGRGRAVWLAAAALACAVGMGAHDLLLAAVFATGFLVLTPAVTLGTRLLAAVISLLAAATVAPHLVEFARLALASARRTLDYQHLFSMPAGDVLAVLAVASPARLERGDAIHYGGAVLLLVLAGAWLVRRRVPRDVARCVWLLGAVPIAAVVSALLLPDLAARVPLIGASSIARMAWFADVFLMLGAGVAVAALLAHPVIGRRPGMAYLIVVLAITPRAAVAWWQLSKFHAVAADLQFAPRQFLGLLEPGTRLATDIDPMFGNFDTKAIPSGVLASTGRSIIMSARLRDQLAAEQLIVPGWFGMTYAFAPAAPDRLAPFGIRYFATRGHAAELAGLGWRQVGHEGDVDLFISPVAATPVYVDGAPLQFLTDYRLHDDSIEVILPPGSERTVVAAFADIGGWRATLDGAAVPMTSRHAMLAATVRGPGRLVFTYAPYAASTIVAVACAAWLALAIVITNRRLWPA